MTEQQKTIKALWPIAHAAASHIRHWHLWTRGADHKQFGSPGWDGSDYIAAAFAEPGVIEYRLKGGADVRIQDIDVESINPEDIEVGPIEPIGPQKVVRADVLPNRNITLDDIPWELEYRDLTAQTTLDKLAREVGASLAVGLRQQVGYGSEIAQISGETELTIQAEASFRQAWERETTAHQEHEVTSKRDMIIRAMHEAVLERVETVGPARQVIRAKGALKFGIRLHAPGNFVHHWDSMDDWCASLQGIETKSGNQWLGFYKANPVPFDALEPFRQTIYAVSEKVREFEKASNIRVDIRSEPLNDKARLTDALRLIALQGSSLELRQLAEAELNSQ